MTGERMTGERITGRLDQVASAMVGRTIAAAVLEDGEFGLRFDDGSWIYGWTEGDEDGVDTRFDEVAEPGPSLLLELGVVDRAERDRILAERRARAERQLEEADRATYERLRARFEGEGEAG